MSALESGDLIAAGTVISVRKISSPDAGTPYVDTEAVIHLSDVWKGAESATVTLTYGEGDGANCGPILNEGDRVSFAAFRDENGLLTTTSCNLGNADRPTNAVLEAYRREAYDIAADLTAHPNSLSAHLQLGRHYEVGRELERASVIYRRILEQDSHVAGAHAGVARILLLRGKSAEALAAVVEGLSQAPEDAELALLKRQLQVFVGEKVDPKTVNFHAFDASDFAWSGVDLRGVDFTRARFSRAHLEMLQLDGANFSDTTLLGVDFAFSSMANVKFLNAELHGHETFGTALPMFYSATLRDADFSWTKSDPKMRDLNAEDFLLAQLAGAKFTGNRISLQPDGDVPNQAATFAKADLTGAVLACQPLSIHDIAYPMMTQERAEEEWLRALAELRVIRDVQSSQPEVTLDRDCKADIDHYLALASDCRPWKPQPGQTGCAFRPQ